MKDKKILWVGAGLAIIVAIVVVIFVANALSQKSEKKSEKEKSNIEALVEAAGKDFYENYYYPILKNTDQLDTIKNFAEGNGVNLPLANLIVTTDISEETKKVLEENNCNYDETKVTIYPEEPFEVDSYTIKVTLSCEE